MEFKFKKLKINQNPYLLGLCFKSQHGKQTL